MPDQRWVFIVRVLDKPGALTATASVFSNRGVSLEAILGSGISSASATNGRLVISFQATERKQEMLQRALERLPLVLSVESFRYDDPQLRAIAIAKLKSIVNLNLSDIDVQAETVSQQPGSSTVLFTGGMIALDTLIDQLRVDDELIDVVMSAIAL